MINSVTLVNYKNYGHFKAEFGPKLNFITGRNGVGKTNLLDAIHYLCITKSFVSAQDRHNVHFGRGFFRIVGEVKRVESVHILEMKVQPGKRKEIVVDGVPGERLSDHLGFMPVIILTPADHLLVDGASAERRRFVDFYLCQTNRDYLRALQSYTRLLTQRNAYLKANASSASSDLLMTYSEKMEQPAKQIQSTRLDFAESLMALVNSNGARISGLSDDVTLRYAPNTASDEFLAKSRAAIEHDKILTRTTVGVHKDDLHFEITGRSLRRYGSQGQRKSYLVALHLAIFDFLTEQHAIRPILLLDDIFDKLDNDRVENLLEILSSARFGQVMITDARPEHVRTMAERIKAEVLIHEIANGVIKPSTHVQKDTRNGK